MILEDEKSFNVRTEIGSDRISYSLDMILKKISQISK